MTKIVRIPNQQAERILQKFGGASGFYKVLCALQIPIEISTIYKWTYPKGEEQGCDGFIPPNAYDILFLAARAAGVLITSEDFDPRTFDPKLEEMLKAKLQTKRDKKKFRHDAKAAMQALSEKESKRDGRTKKSQV